MDMSRFDWTVSLNVSKKIVGPLLLIQYPLFKFA